MVMTRILILRTFSSPYVCSVTVAIVLIFVINIAYASDFFAVEEFVTENIKASIIEDDVSHTDDDNDSDEHIGHSTPPVILRQENGIFTTIDTSDDNYVESVMVSISFDISEMLEKYDTVEITLKGANSTVSEDNIDDEYLIRYIILR